MLIVNVGIVPSEDTEITKFEKIINSHLSLIREDLLKNNTELRLMHYRKSFNRIAELKGIGGRRKINATTIRPDILEQNVSTTNIHDVPTDHHLILIYDNPFVRRFCDMILLHEARHAHQKILTPYFYLNLAAQHFLNAKIASKLQGFFQNTELDKIIKWLVDFTERQKELEQKHGFLPFYTMDPYMEYDADFFCWAINTERFKMWREELRKQEKISILNLLKLRGAPFQYLLGLYCYKRTWGLAFGESYGFVNAIFRLRWNNIRKAGIELSNCILDQEYERYLRCLVKIFAENKSSPFKSKIYSDRIAEIAIRCMKIVSD